MMKVTIFNISDETFGIDISRSLNPAVQDLHHPLVCRILSGVMSVAWGRHPVMDSGEGSHETCRRKERIILVSTTMKDRVSVDNQEILVLNPDEIRPSPSIFKVQTGIYGHRARRTRGSFLLLLLTPCSPQRNGYDAGGKDLREKKCRNWKTSE